jgi:hypothetical protein
LQQYRSYNQKPNAHGSRKQLHPQHIIRPAPSSTTTVIHHAMPQDAKTNNIPMIMSGSAVRNLLNLIFKILANFCNDFRLRRSRNFRRHRPQF